MININKRWFLSNIPQRGIGDFYVTFAAIFGWLEMLLISEVTLHHDFLIYFQLHFHFKSQERREA